MNLKDKKCLIAYFSRPGNNYVNNRIRNLPVGNTEIVAKRISEMTEGDIFRINTVNSYPEDYTETTEVAQKELHENQRPELSNHVENMDSYNVIFLGYPNWWGTMPMAIFTFLDEYDFAGKTIVPFCTHEGSGLGRSEQDIAKLCPQSTILDGLAVRGGIVKNAVNRRGGNSDILCDQFTHGAEEAGNETEKIFLRDKEINYCVACDSCLKNDGICASKDDMAEILDKMIEADVIVMATPVYFYTMDAQMKTLIDRTYPKYTEIANKDFYFIATAAVTRKQALERTIEGFRGFTSVLNGSNEKGIIYGTGAWNIGDIKSSNAMNEAYEMGKAI